MESIGSYLKSGREAKNIRLSEVAQSTKISKWYLDCLEKDEFDKIPGGPYIKGYITSYASFIGLEEDEILKRYDSLQINNDEEDETQEQLASDKKTQGLRGFFFSGKKLVILSMATLLLLSLGIYYFFFQKRTHIVAKLPDVQHSKMQSPPPAGAKQGETRPASHDASVQSAERNDFSRKVANKPPKKRGAGNSVQVADVSEDIHLNPQIKGKEFNPAYHDATGIESLALLTSESKVERISKAPPAEKNEIRPNEPTGKEAIRHHEASSAQIAPIKQDALPASRNSLNQSTTQSASPYSESTPMHQAAATQAQAANTLRVIKAVATSDITNRNPEEPGNSFQWSTERVYIWSMIECESPPASIRHTYYFEGQKVNDIVLEIKSPQWRTWSYKSLLDKRWIGQWKVDITTIEGELLKRIFFAVN